MSHAKPAEDRAGHHAAPAVITGAGLAQRTVPPVPDVLEADEVTAARWVGLWTSPVAAVLDPVSDLEPVTRLFKLYRRDAQFDAALDRQLGWLEAGDLDMPFDPQFARVRLAIAAEIRQLEQTLGITPRGRLVIGAAVLAAGKAQEVEHDDADD